MNAVPLEIQWAIMEFVDDPETLQNLKLTCKTYHTIYYSPSFSKLRYERKLKSLIIQKGVNQSLKWASYHGNLYMVKQLIEKHGATSIKQSLECARKKNHGSIIEYLQLI